MTNPSKTSFLLAKARKYFQKNPKDKLGFLKRLVLFATIIPVTCLCIGFYIGQADKRILSRLGLISDTITLVAENSNFFSPAVIQSFEQESGLHLRILEANNFEDFRKFSVDADLWLARTCWLERLSNFRKTPSLVHEAWAEKNISPDFLIFKHQELHSAPLFWRIEEQTPPSSTKTAIANDTKQKISLTLIGIKSRKTKLAKLGVEILTSKSFIQRWLQETSWSTTYMTLDESFIKKNQKAGSIRDLPFQKLELIDSQNTKCDQKTESTSNDNPQPAIEKSKAVRK